MEEAFKSGDLVFAKMKGWSPWPAKVLKRADRKVESYEVEFYGTQQRSVVLPKCLFPYNEDTKNKYGGDRRQNKQVWEDALQEIEKDTPISTSPKKVKTKTKLTEVTPQPFQPRRSTLSTAKIEEKPDEGTEIVYLLPPRPRRLSRKRSSNSEEIKDNRGKSAKVSSAIVNDNDTNPPKKETPLLNLRASDSSPPTIQTAEQKDSDDNVNDASKDANSPEGETLLLHPRTSGSSPPTVQTAEEDADNDGNEISKDTSPPEDHPQTPESIPSTVQIAEQNDSDTNSPDGETLLLHPPTVQTAEEMDSDNDGNSDGKDANTPEDHPPESIPPSVQIAEQNHSGNDASEDTKSAKEEMLLLHPPTIQAAEGKDSDNDGNNAGNDTNPPEDHPRTPESISPTVQIDELENYSWSHQAVFGIEEEDGLVYTLDHQI